VSWSTVVNGRSSTVRYRDVNTQGLGGADRWCRGDNHYPNSIGASRGDSQLSAPDGRDKINMAAVLPYMEDCGARCNNNSQQRPLLL